MTNQISVFIRDIEHVLLKSANEGTTDLLSQELINYLGVDINIERLKVQLAMLPDVIKTAFDDSIKRLPILEQLQML